MPLKSQNHEILILFLHLRLDPFQGTKKEDNEACLGRADRQKRKQCLANFYNLIFKIQNTKHLMWSETFKCYCLLFPQNQATTSCTSTTTINAPNLMVNYRCLKTKHKAQKPWQNYKQWLFELRQSEEVEDGTPKRGKKTTERPTKQCPRILASLDAGWLADLLFGIFSKPEVQYLTHKVNTQGWMVGWLARLAVCLAGKYFGKKSHSCMESSQDPSPLPPNHMQKGQIVHTKWSHKDKPCTAT